MVHSVNSIELKDCEVTVTFTVQNGGISAIIYWSYAEYVELHVDYNYNMLTHKWNSYTLKFDWLFKVSGPCVETSCVF